VGDDCGLNAWVSVRIGEGQAQRLDVGAIIGRAPWAALRIDEPSISEAHALVSLRGSGLRLLALRGRLVHKKKRVSDVELRARAQVTLGPGILLEVIEIHLPQTVLGLEAAEVGRFIPPPVASFMGAGLSPVNGCAPNATATLWRSDDGFRLRRPGQDDVAVGAGDMFKVDEISWRVVEIPVGEAGLRPTRPTPPMGLPKALTIFTRYDTVHIWVDGRAVAIDGIPARIISELAAFGVPVEWALLARGLWPDEEDRNRLRVLWDGAMGRF